MERAVKDNRFSDVFNNTRFKPIPNKGRKVKIDKRFQAMFKDSSFKLKYSMDNKGRPSQVTSSEELRKFYHLSSDSESESVSETETIKKQDSDIATENEDKTLTKSKESNSFEKEVYSKVESSAKSSDSSDNESPHPSEHELACVGAESGSTTSEESDLEDLDDDFDHQWGELHADAPDIDHPTNRFAICNMDWDRIKAEDLFVLLNSFKPPDKILHSVKIYPSEFGAQRMKEEEVNGPKELVETSFHSYDNEDDKEEKSVHRREKLRQYQISRLKYYFAIVECDSPETALILYNELDGMEYESSAACLDLRFVPEDMTFDQEPSSVATSVPNMSTYKPILFTTTAFQQVKVNLTWDETDPRRSQVMKSLFTEDNPNVDISTYLASSSEDEGVEENSDENSVSKGNVKDKVSKYKELLQNIENEKEKDRGDVELEISWEPGLRKAAEDLVKAKQKKENAKTPWEQYLEKRKERKKQKKKQSLQDDQSSDSSEDDIVSKPSSKKGMKKVPEDEETDTKEREMLELLTGEDRSVIKENKTAKKRKKKFEKTKKQDDFKVDVKDPRFSAIYTNSLYNIDPSDSHYKKTEGMKAFVEQKQCQMKSGKYENGDKARDISFQETQSLAASIKTKLLKAKKKKIRNMKRN